MSVPLPFTLEEYRSAATGLDAFLTTLARRRERRWGLPKWVVTSRLKTEESIQRKWDSFCTDYADKDQATILSWMTDIAGVRAIVESRSCVTALRDYICDLCAEYFDPDLPIGKQIDDYVESPRGDGYRGVHLRLGVPDPIHSRPVPVELQIRSVVQHQWALLSHRDFYKSEDEIPPYMLGRMRSLSELLECADRESQFISRGQLWGQCRVKVRDALELTLQSLEDTKSPSSVGATALLLVEFEKQLRQAMSSSALDGRLRAIEGLEAIVKKMPTPLKSTCAGIADQVRVCTEVIPRELRDSNLKLRAALIRSKPKPAE